MSRQAHRGRLVDCLDDPYLAPEAVRHFADGVLLIEDGHVIAVGDYEALAPRLEGVEMTDHGGCLIMPGMVDCHVHFPQVDVIASHGEQLLEWLESYTFPAEMAFADRAHAESVARFFLDELLTNGTTTALIFGSVHEAATDALFAEALRRNMRLIAGKALMDRNVPGALRDTAEGGIAASRRLIEKWHGRGRLGYAVTPRFAPACSEQQLRLAGALLAERPDLLLHTHLSENRAEIGWVEALFETGYLETYERYGLVGDRSVFAHCVHLEDGERRRMAAADAAIAFCPTSNLFLGSGLFDLKAARQAGIRVGLGTDIGAGTSFSLLATAGEAYKVCQLRGHGLDGGHAAYLATLGGARALKLDHRIGNFEPGKEADFIIVDLEATPLLARRSQAAPDIGALLFILAVLADDRAVKATYLMGEKWR